MSGYLGRLLQATARSEQRLHPFAGSIYDERTAETAQSVGPAFAMPHWAALDRPENERSPGPPMAKTSEPEPMAPFERRAMPQPWLDLREPDLAELNSPSVLHSSAARPPDSIRTMTATGEPSGPARTGRDGHGADSIATLHHGRLRLHDPQSETFAARAGDVTARFATVATDPDHAPALEARLDQAAPPVAAALPIQRPTRDQNLTSRMRAEEPEVQIHIGRVEVLAVQPPAPAPRRETATRLADYLAARSGSAR